MNEEQAEEMLMLLRSIDSRLLHPQYHGDGKGDYVTEKNNVAESLYEMNRKMTDMDANLLEIKYNTNP